MRNGLLRLLFHLLRIVRPSTPREPKTFLVLHYRLPLGCCVHATPLFSAIKSAYPDSTLIVATRGLGHAVFQHDPHIDHLLETPDPGESLRSLWSAAISLRKQLAALNLRPTLILQDATNRRGTLALFAQLLRLAPVSGFADAPPLYDTHLPYNPGLSLIDNNLRLLGPNTPHIEPAVYFTAEELATAQALRDHAAPHGRPLTAFIVQGSGLQPNNWHDDRFTTVIRHIESLGHATVFLGTPAEAPVIERVRSVSASQGLSLAGRTSVPELAALLCLCDLLITVDTGSMHVGRAAGVPMIVLGPSWQPPIEWLPLAVPNTRVLRGETRTGIPANYQLDEISTESVIDAVTQLSKTFPPSAAAHQHRTARLLSTVRP